MSRRTRAALAAVSIATLATTVALAPPAQAAAPKPITVASGLNNPRQLSVGPGQRIYVAEAGTDENCAPFFDEGWEEYAGCGLTGSVAEIRGSAVTRVVTGLPAMTFNGEMIGPSDVDVRGNNVAVLVGGPAGATGVRADMDDEYKGLGTLRTGRLKSQPVSGADLAVVADLAEYELQNDPDGQDHPDSNAVGFAAIDSKNWVVADAGGNDLVAVGKRGESLLAVFPNGAPVPNPFGPGMIPPQAVPTDVAVGPDGAYYVSQLTGFPFPTGGSTIWRVVPGQDPTAYATGLTMVTSLAWKGDTLYAVQLDDENFFDGHVGSLVKIAPDGTQTKVVSGLDAPYGVAIRGNDAFVTTNSISSGGGEVVRISLR